MEQKMEQISRTVFYDRHVAAGAKMVDFAGWRMPLHYSGGIVAEHLATRKTAGLFDVSHMGRFILRGGGALELLQHVLTNNAAALEVGLAQYTMIPNAAGGAIDDAYLYRFRQDEYLLVVNAANRLDDLEHLQRTGKDFGDVELTDRTEQLAMLSLQGAASKEILSGLIESGRLPEPMRNALSIVSIDSTEVLVGRTGYTGEPLGFELFVPAGAGPAIWDSLVERGAAPVGLGARDTLRLEAGLPLYGHELGTDPDGREIPIFACPLAKFAVSLSSLKGDFIGRGALTRQNDAYGRILAGDFSRIADLPRIIRPVALVGKGVARAGDRLFTAAADDKHVGFVTSGTMVPYWRFAGEGLAGAETDESAMRSICLALVDSNLRDGREVTVEIRSARRPGVIVPYHLRSEAPPQARPTLCERVLGLEDKPAPPAAAEDAGIFERIADLLDQSIENTLWRQNRCINLIPSEQTLSPMVRLLSVMDPAGRYAEHKAMKAFYDAEVFYYQGTGFIERVERLLEEQMRLFLGCREVETRLISGQMANATVFSAMVDYLNRSDRKAEPRRIRCVLNNHIIKGGHLSSQPMGALRDFVARDPQTERPAVVNFPVLADNPYKIDVAACRQIIEQHRPELIIFGKSMVLHREPVAEIRQMVDELSPQTVIMYDMAHVLGLIGPLFQQPFAEGADIVTGSTHKTFFGTQRGVAAADLTERDERYPLWEAIRRRTFPGAVSNHHLGTMLGLLMAAYEMNHFKDQYAPKVLANARAFAAALAHCGLDVSGDSAAGYTETHQVVVEVGYGRGPEAAKRLEENNIIVNYQASPAEEGFTAAGALRMGVAEMTRFGMDGDDFQTVAQFIRDVLVEGKSVKREVESFRKNFTELKFCFTGARFAEQMRRLRGLL